MKEITQIREALHTIVGLWTAELDEDGFTSSTKHTEALSVLAGALAMCDKLEAQPPAKVDAEAIMAECQRCYTDGLAGNRGWAVYSIDLRARLNKLLNP